MKAAAFSALMLLVLQSLAHAAQKIPTVDGLLQTQGEFVFSDGSSVYRLLKDRTFVLEPAGMSGRSIKGTWKKKDASFFVITGKWEWQNGRSAGDDYRRMTVHVNVTSGAPQDARRLRLEPKIRVYPVYFTIEELVKTTKQEFERAAAAAKARPAPRNR